MKTKRGQRGRIRIIYLWDGSDWSYSCLLYKDEIPSFYQYVTRFKGPVKSRYRLAGSLAWHYVVSSDF